MGRRGDGRRSLADAEGLWRRAHRRDRHAGAAALGGDGPVVLEGLARARRTPMAGRGRRAAGSRVRREDGRGTRRGPDRGLAAGGPPAAHPPPERGPGRLDRWALHDPGDAGPLGGRVPGDPPPQGEASSPRVHKPVRPSAREPSTGPDPGGPLPGLDRPSPPGPALPPASGLGGRAPRARDLDGDPGVRPRRGLAGQSGLVAGDVAPSGPLLHAQLGASGVVARHPHLLPGPDL